MAEVKTWTRYDVVRTRNVPDEWRVESVHEDGAVSVVLFSGFNAENEAKAFVAWKHYRPAWVKTWMVE